MGYSSHTIPSSVASNAGVTSQCCYNRQRGDHGIALPNPNFNPNPNLNPVSQVEQGILPAPLLPGMLDFYNNYKMAVLGSGVPGADERSVASVMGAIADRRVLAECCTAVTNRKSCVCSVRTCMCRRHACRGG